MSTYYLRFYPHGVDRPDGDPEVYVSAHQLQLVPDVEGIAIKVVVPDGELTVEILK